MVQVLILLITSVLLLNNAQLNHTCCCLAIVDGQDVFRYYVLQLWLEEGTKNDQQQHEGDGEGIVFVVGDNQKA